MHFIGICFWRGSKDEVRKDDPTGGFELKLGNLKRPVLLAQKVMHSLGVLSGMFSCLPKILLSAVCIQLNVKTVFLEVSF